MIVQVLFMRGFPRKYHEGEGEWGTRGLNGGWGVVCVCVEGRCFAFLTRNLEQRSLSLKQRQIITNADELSLGSA